jgi:glyoxylase-like metal-dependent hydrolase (beta-lactamase superfamily II)
MKIINLTENSAVYTSNVYLVLGDWNAIDDVNTLIDVGQDDTIFEKIDAINTGLGKKKIDQVILTHSHSDHAALLSKIKERYNPKIYAANTFLSEVDHFIKDGEMINIADSKCEVYQITTHSHDSVCLHCKKEGFLFSGDTHFPVELENLESQQQNLEVLNRLSKKRITVIFPGHGDKIDTIPPLFKFKKAQQTI